MLISDNTFEFNANGFPPCVNLEWGNVQFHVVVDWWITVFRRF